MKRTITHLMALLVLVSMLAITLTACGTPTVNLNDYVEITVDGYEGYGSVHASLNYSQLIEDHADRLTDKLDSQFFGSQTPNLAANMIFATYEPFALAYESPDDLKNGDTVSFTWNTSASAIEKLSTVLDVEFRYESFDYTVKGLDALKEVDPFENVPLDTWGISGEGSLSDYLKAKVQVSDEDTLSLDLSYDYSKSGTYSNGDVLHVTLKDPDPERYAKQYGVIWSRTEVDILLNGFSYYPQDDPQEVFQFLTEGNEAYENALKAATELVQVEGEERQVEFAGALFYYQNEGNNMDLSGNDYNQLVLIYHVTNGKVPGGWYTYLAPSDNAVICYQDPEDGTQGKELMREVSKQCFSFGDSHHSYAYQLYSSWDSYNHPITFTYDGVRYVGHQTIEDCVAAYEANALPIEFFLSSDIFERNYDHLIVSDSLKDLVTER